MAVLTLAGAGGKLSSVEDFEITAHALALVDLGAYADRSYQSLSGGEKQRVVLARAIAQEPQMLVLDEPTNHLDIKYQLQILSIVKKLGVGPIKAPV
jgi:iron complex transport system ATP-binding protein